MQLQPLKKCLPTLTTVLFLSAIALLPGCASAPVVPPRAQPVQLTLPPLNQRKAALEPRFTARMENFLQGKLPAPTASSPSSNPAKSSTETPK